MSSQRPAPVYVKPGWPAGEAVSAGTWVSHTAHAGHGHTKCSRNDVHSVTASFTASPGTSPNSVVDQG